MGEIFHGGVGESNVDNIWEEKLVEGGERNGLSEDDMANLAEAMGKTGRYTDMPDEADDQYFKNYEDAQREEDEELREALGDEWVDDGPSESGYGSDAHEGSADEGGADSIDQEA